MRLVLFAATPSVSVRLPAELFIFEPIVGYTVDGFGGYQQEDVQIINRGRALDMHRQQRGVSMVLTLLICRPGCACMSSPAKPLNCSKIHQPHDAGLQHLVYSYN